MTDNPPLAPRHTARRTWHRRGSRPGTESISSDIPRMYGVAEVIVCLFGFHNNEIRAQLASYAAEPADFPSGALELTAFPSSRRTSPVVLAPIRSQPPSCWRRRCPRSGDQPQDVRPGRPPLAAAAARPSRVRDQASLEVCDRSKHCGRRARGRRTRPGSLLEREYRLTAGRPVRMADLVDDDLRSAHAGAHSSPVPLELTRYMAFSTEAPQCASMR
jgi:hypothetical protein